PGPLISPLTAGAGACDPSPVTTSQAETAAPRPEAATRIVRDERLYTGFRLLLRAALALAMIGSGIARLIPVQMPPLRPLDLLQRLGELTQGELLRGLIGASPVFQSFTGLAALLGGVLLLFSRTALLGALICAANLAMAVTLAFCYDLPSKLYVSCLLFLSLLLLAPHLRRLIDLFFLDRAVEPAEAPPAAGGWSDRLLPLLGLGVIAWGAAVAVPRFGQLHPPKPPFYGAWAVEELTVDGEESADPRQWRWAVFQDPDALDVELRIGSRKRYALDLDRAGKTLTLDRRARFTFQEPEEGVLVLEGRLDGRRTRAKLRRMRLSSPWFHWITDPSQYE
ncbi:MAG TPA: hypothetical protein VF756_11855, partial [Thermoanaerobaculia bacterium]